MLFHVLVLLHLLPSGHSACVRSLLNTHEEPGEQEVFVEEGDANSFLSRRLLKNHFDFEMLVKGNLERECYEEVCNYEEAREVFENIPQTVDNCSFSTENNKPSRVDVTALLVGLIAGGVVIIIVGLLVWYYCQNKRKDNVSRGNSFRARRRRRSNASLIMRRLEEVSSQPVPPPGSPPNDPLGPPSYEQAIARSGQHDAPPPPYPGSRHGSVQR
ncbi:transmembrane gamma-carboxyglutamic acid protein 4 isoform X2 [Nelusetta ayraudi]|uniref:transmembrane gamma-carboxyglutamic acid protein 4 isoform X2 n=1 Tax=Nelusetta ayraudi TaxID=303726 RepID=UPI003F702E48